MRKFFSTTAGATFNEETPKFTMAVRRTHIELIFKMTAGLYGIINLIHLDNGKGLLMANWNGYFNRLQNPVVQMPRIAKTCPKLYDVLCHKDKDNVVEATITMEQDKENVEGLAIEVDLPEKTALVYCLTQDLRNKAFLLAVKGSFIFDEINSNPPFPGWKDGLDLVWN